MNIAAVIAQELNIKLTQSETVIRLIDEGNTIPFISRYRKEMTGGLNDEVLRVFEERLRYLNNLEDRRKAVISSVEEQGKMTEELRKALDAAQTMTALEDIYRPYKQKRRTRAMIAKEKGLEPLAVFMQLSPAAAVRKEAAAYVIEGKDIPDVDTAIRMAEDIIAENISDNAQYRTEIRKRTAAEGLLTTDRAKSSGKTDAAAPKDRKVPEKLAARAEVYENYYGSQEVLRKMPGHRVLAVNRGEKEKFLTVRIEAPEDKIIEYLDRQSNPKGSEFVREAVKDAYKRLIAPSIETEIRNEMTQKAEDGAMKVFASNLQMLLMQPPMQGKTVLGWDPAFRTGCKLAVVDPTGKVLATTVIYPTAPQNKVDEAMKVLESICRKYKVDVISVGNGTASRESEQIIAQFIKKSGLPVRYVIVNEAGASVYSASKLAAEEFPNFDVGQRSAASIARRLQDPLAELVKIDPKAIGVGQYQHDMDQARLGSTLGAVVEDCVNSVGVDANTASAALLSYISGINKTVAANIVAYRELNGRFASRKELMKVPKLGPKCYEQCAGFLRITGGKFPLDGTAVHPESYDAAEKLLKELGYTTEDITSGRTAGIRKAAAAVGMKKLADLTGLGEYTLSDVISELEKPGRDPRESAEGPALRNDVIGMEDLQPGMILQGTVRNIVDFGAFVDIGVHQDGLVHISQIADRYIKHPLDAVKVGDIVKVKVLSVDASRKRISLTMKDL